MKLNQIDNGQRTHEVTPATEAGLKVKSHVKAGLGGFVGVTPPRVQPIPIVGLQPIFVCG